MRVGWLGRAKHGRQTLFAMEQTCSTRALIQLLLDNVCINVSVHDIIEASTAVHGAGDEVRASPLTEGAPRDQWVQVTRLLLFDC